MKAQVRIRRECNYCKGEGVIQSPAWKELYDHAGPRPPRKIILRFFGAENEEEMPPEEISCPRCGGAGFVYDWVDLGIFGKILERERRSNED